MRLKKDRYRPLLHFTPSKGWTNDPNGLVWYNGWYHLFYQYNPDSTVWGPMHWGHARSRNLIRWQHLPVALRPDDDGMIFSGSAAVDTDNLTGWNRHRPGMLAMYTLHGHQEQQAIAWSDNGRKFRKFERNPVIANPGLPDFRDPKLFRVPGEKGWRAVLAAGDRLFFYYSKDLQRWRKSGEFTYKGSDFLHNGIWECPDMVLLPAPDGNQYWVLLLSVNMDKSDGGSRECYWIGSFENGTFMPMESAPDPRWLDEGTDFYAGVTYNQTPHSRKVMMGWMNNWVYAAKIPADDFRGTMALPRELRLVYAGHRLVLAQNPVEELKRFRGAYADFDTQQQGGEVEIPLAKDSFEIELQNEGAYACELMNDAGDSLLFGMNDQGEVYIDRSKSGRRDFSEDFYPEMHTRCVSEGDLHQARAVFDVQSLEVFFDDGRQTMTALAFPHGRYTLVRIRGSVHGTLYISLRP